jgi:hypothetical protein
MSRQFYHGTTSHRLAGIDQKEDSSGWSGRFLVPPEGVGENNKTRDNNKLITQAKV